MLIHGNNLEQKETHQTKYRDEKSKKYLTEIRVKYDQWKQANEDLKGPMAKVSENDSQVIAARVWLLNDYKDFVDPYHLNKTGFKVIGEHLVGFYIRHMLSK